MLRATRLLLALAALPAATAPALARAASAAATAPTTTITAHLNRPGGAIDRALIGFDFHFGGPAPQAIAPLHPRIVRLDASLEQISPRPGVLDLGRLQARVGALRRIGAEPLVILDYTPPWLAQPLAPPGGGSKTEPNDLNAWRALIERLAVALATGPGRVRLFEAWNEPDLPSYWAGTQAQFLDTAAASAEAVHAAAVQTRLGLRFGGPASFIPDQAEIEGFVSRLRSDGVPPAFVSWHYYANYPCLGPDGPENPGDPSSLALQKSLGCVNPSASPTFYSTGISMVRQAISTAAPGAPPPELILDEWNLSAGGLDRRMTTNDDAAFATGTLITFQQDGLGASAFYQATDTDPRPGGWGTVSFRGARRPVWWAFSLWGRLAPRAVSLDGSDPSGGLWALASRTRSAQRVTVLLASFSVASPQARTVRVVLAGLPRRRAGWRATIARIDAVHGGGQPAARVRLGSGDALNLELPAQAVTLLTVAPGPSASPRHRRR